MHEVYRFGPFELDAAVQRLYRGGKSLDIEPRPLEVLAELLRNAGQVVTKGDLMDKVWPDRVVTDSAITRCVNLLRATLGDRARTLIVTVHGYGYRYTGEVLRVTPAAGAAVPAATWTPAAGLAVPGRGHWLLERALDQRACVWLARHQKTGERRVFKFALDPARLGALKRELTIHRLLKRALPERDYYVRLLDCSFESTPYFLELEHCALGNLADWLAAQGGAGAVPLDLRLELVAQAAEALAAAHAVGVLHHDVKPGNLLVRAGRDGAPRACWTDFGSGRLLEPERLAQLEITRLGLTRTQAEGDGTTPLYTAPEVLAGQKPSVLSDIYALGVVLYQVAVGDLRRPLASGWEQEIPDELLREDIAHAAHGNPERRLPAAAELAARLRGLGARRTAREAAREREAVAHGLAAQLARNRARRPWIAGAVATLGLGLAASLYYYRAALEARDAAREQAALAEAVTNFFNEDVLNSATPYQLDHRGDMTVREAVDRAAARLDGRFPDQPLTEAAIRTRLGALYLQRAALAQAGLHYGRAAALYAAARGPNHSETLSTQYSRVAVLTFDSRFAEAGELLDELGAVIAADARLQAEFGSRLEAFYALYNRQLQRYLAVVPYAERSLADMEARSPDDSPMVAMRRYYLARDYAQVGRFADAQRLFERVFAVLEASETPGSTFTGLARGFQGAALFLEGRHAEAAAVLEQAHDTLARTVGPTDDAVAESAGYLCLARVALGQHAAALDACRESLAAYEARFGAGNHFALNARGNLGVAELAAGRARRAIGHLEAARAGLVPLLGAGAPAVQLFGFHLAEAYLAAGEPAARAAALLAALEPAALRLARPQADWEAGLAALRERLPATPTVAASTASP